MEKSPQSQKSCKNVGIFVFAAGRCLKRVIDAALDGREDAHEGMVVAAVVVVGDLRKTHKRRAGTRGNQMFAIGVTAAWCVDGKVTLAAEINAAQGSGGFHHEPFSRPTGGGNG